MAKQRIINTDVKYLVFTEVYQRMVDPKTGRRAFSLLEAAIQCFSRKGFNNVTLEMIAREAGVTRPLIRHYFDDLGDIQKMSMKYIRLLFQKVAVDSMLKCDSPENMLTQYVDGCFSWVDNMGVHAKVWLSFLHKCTVTAEARALNTVAVDAGHERIQALLEEGSKLKVFAFENSCVTAKMVQTLITGALISYASENMSDEKNYCHSIQQSVLLMVGHRKILLQK